MLSQRRFPRRKGATLTEAGVTLTAVLMLVLGTLDLGTAAFCLEVLSEAARQGVRQAVVHGNSPGNLLAAWGPASYGPAPATSGDPPAQAIAPYLVGMDPSQVTILYQWPDGNNNVQSRVQVTVTASWTPLLGFLFGNTAFTLTGSSTMPIAH
jgi:hypothetical protein